MIREPLRVPCRCGGLKDVRAEQCRKCKDGALVTERICTRCHELKSISEFRMRTRNIQRPRSRCKMCESLDSREATARKPQHEQHLATRRWEKNNPEKVRLQNLRTRVRNAGLGDMIDELIPRLIKERKCECCQQEVKKLAVDHCHMSGKFRGLICEQCNLGLGIFKDDTKRLQNAIEYLQRNEENKINFLAKLDRLICRKKKIS